MSDPLVNLVHERVVNLTGVPKPNAEFFQVLRYEPGQFYKVHHDQNAHYESLMGVRLFTFFIYLRSPTHGGATRLRMVVSPSWRRHSSLSWPPGAVSPVARLYSRSGRAAGPPRAQ